MDRMAAVAREGLRTDIPAFASGDTIKVMVRVREGDKERLQAFEGLCMGKRGGGINETFRVRKVSAGVGVERVFPGGAAATLLRQPYQQPRCGGDLGGTAPGNASANPSGGGT